jgi:hypothetical protein
MTRTLFLQAPTRDSFDTGARSSYQASREIRSLPTWLAQAAALVPCTSAAAARSCRASYLDFIVFVPICALRGDRRAHHQAYSP